MTGYGLGILAIVPGWLSVDSLIAYFVFGAIAGVIAIALIVVKKIMPIASFAYAVTRIRVMASQMIREKKLKELAESYSYKDVIASFEGTSYEQCVAGKKEIDDIEKGLSLNLAEDYEKIVRMAPKRAQDFFKMASHRYEIENVKRIIASKATGEEIEGLFPSPMSDAFLQRLKDADNVQETIELLKLTNLKEAVEGIHADSSAEEIKKTLDKFLYEKLFDKNKIAGMAKKAGVMNDQALLMEIYGSYIDILNIKIALRCIMDGLNEKDIKELMIKNYFFLPEKNAIALAESSDIPTAINNLDGTPYYETLNEAVRDFSKGKGLYSIEKALDSYYLNKIRSIYLMQPFGLTPIACYLMLKESEINTLKAILNGIEEGVPKEKIKELFVGV